MVIMEERRKNHMEMLPECIQVFKRVEEKIDVLIDYNKEINGRYQKHIEESVPFRSKVAEIDREIAKHDVYKNQLTGAMTGIVFAIIVQVVSFSYLWGSINKQVEINTNRWDKLLANDAHAEIK